MVLVIAAVLTTLATPSLLSLIQSNRTSAEINFLSSDAQFARAQAIQTGINVVICASTNGTSCNVSNGSWAGGWIVFTDVNNNQIVNANDRILRVQQSLGNTDVLVSVPAGTNFISFNRSGLATGLAGTIAFTVRTTPVSANATRCMVINVVGRQQMQSNLSNPTTCA